MRVEQVIEGFRARFEGRPRVFRAPGRVNLIGEHTDYTGGLVLPVAIDLVTLVAAAPRTDREIVVHSAQFSETAQIRLDDPDPETRHWSDAVRGVARLLEHQGTTLTGASLCVDSTVPLGAGLSSSAALEVSAGLALTSLAGRSMDPMALAKLCQAAEHEFVGTRCGLMDQFISCCGRAGQAVLLDCRSLRSESVPLLPGVRIAVCDTRVKHEHGAGEYNVRRAQCEQATRHIARRRPGVLSLRDVTAADLSLLCEDLDELSRRRARHVVTENLRVEAAVDALRRSDHERLGALMADSHRSLRDDFEVSCRELDLMVEIAREIEGVVGVRMTGGGFGGSAIALVRDETVDEFTRTVSREYRGRTGREPAIHVCRASDGARELEEFETRATAGSDRRTA